MAIPRPESAWKRFWKTTVPHDIGTAIAGSGTSAAAAARFFNSSPPSPGWGTLAASGAILTLLIQMARARRTYSQQVARTAVHDLAGCLHTLNTILLGSEDQKVVGLRSTVHVTDKKELVQVLDYIGDERKKNTSGRRMPVNCGVIGRAYREKEVFFGSNG